MRGGRRYRIVRWAEGKNWGVDDLKANRVPRGFHTRAAARAWIAKQKRRAGDKGQGRT